ncbi:hypothetical protein FRB94_006334 [Tulasnella sp. JGI-2019a]|nr:hypothetical protein FRB94_006334 [Tulasnella sp. JGI-2019a]
MGEYDGSPSYIVQSGKGMIWLNIPDPLSSLLDRISDNSILDLSLGSEGRFYIKWKEAGKIRQRLSRGLWQTMDEDPNTPLDRLSLGVDDIFWGVCSGGEVIYRLELSFRGQISKAVSDYQIRDFGFFSLGAEDTFCYDLAGTIYTRAKDPRLKRKIQAAKKAGKDIINVVLSPESTTSWMIMYADGTDDGMLPPEWWEDIGPYFKLKHSLLSRPTVPKSPLRKLSSRSAEFHELQDLFISGWQHPHKEVPKVACIFAIDLPQSLLRPYQAYRAQLEQDLGPHRLNERKAFHGTPRSCCVGDPDNTIQLCKSSSCNLCRIIRTSFRVDLAGTAPGRDFMRFGYGLYTTSVSSKADDYNTEQDNSPYKAMLIARVILGSGRSLRRNSKFLTAPPANYNSVLGIVGVDLNYDEQVVYRDDAIRPAYLLVYSP